MAKLLPVQSLAEYAELVKPAFADEERYHQISAEALTVIETKLTALCSAVKPDAAIEETLKNSVGWVTYGAQRAAIKKKIEFESIYTKPSGSRAPSRSRSKSRSSSKSRSRSRGRHKYRDASELSDNTDLDINDADAVRSHRLQTHKRRQKAMSSVSRIEEYLPLCINNFSVQEIIGGDTINNIMTRAIKKPYDPQKFRSMRDIADYSDPILGLFFIAAFFNEARDKLKDSAPSTLERYENVEAHLLGELPKLVLRLTPSCINKSIGTVFNNPGIAIDTFETHFDEKTKMLSSNSSNAIGTNYHHNVPHELCWNNYLLSCSGCSKPHVCPELLCLGVDHPIWDCPNAPIKNYVKTRLRGSYYYFLNNGNKRGRGRGRGRGGGRGYTPYYPQNYTPYNMQYDAAPNSGSQSTNTGPRRNNNYNNRRR